MVDLGLQLQISLLFGLNCSHFIFFAIRIVIFALEAEFIDASI